MAVDQKNISDLEKMWGSTSQVDQSTIDGFLKDWGSLIGGAGNLGAQNQEYAYTKLANIQDAFNKQIAEKDKALKTISPAFDYNNYIDPSYQLWSAGSGEMANRYAPLERARLELKAKNDAIAKAQAAAIKYQQTGVIDPYPDRKAMIMASPWATQGSADETTAQVRAKAEALAAGLPLPAESQAAANGAAASVGAPLPYPNSTIGQISEGSVFQNAQQAQQAYSGGQLNAIGQNIVSSNSAGNLKNGINQVTKNADGTLSWNGQTFKTEQDAINAAQVAGVGSLRFSDGTAIAGSTGGTGNVSGTGANQNGTTGSPTSPTGTTGTGTPVIDPAAQANAISVLNKYLNDGTIDSGTYQFFKKAVEAWDPSQQVDYANILNTFETIKNTDINPYFKQQADLFVNDLQTNRKYLEDTNALQKTQTQQDTEALKLNMQKNLAASGQMFTGEAVRQLGDQSAFAQTGTPQAQASAIPTISAFGTGELQKQTQAATSANDLRYQKSLADLAQQAESTLGSSASAGLIPGTTQVGGITGTLENQKKQAQASALTGLYNQSQQNVAAQEPQKVFQE